MKRMIQIIVTALALGVAACAAGAQQAPPPAKAEPAKPKAKKVWSNEDVTSLRHPADVYEEKKRKQAEEEAAKAKQQSAPGKAAPQSSGEKAASPADAYLPKTVEEAEKRIAEKREEIQFQTEYIERLRDAVANADSDLARAALQKKLDGFIALLNEANAELKTLEGRLQELKAKAEAPKPPGVPPQK